MERSERIGLLLGVTAAVIVIDQVIKDLVLRHYLHEVGDYGPVSINVVFNRGTAFGIGQGLLPFLLAIGALAVVAAAFYLNPARTRMRSLALGLVLGGALSNLADRLFRSHHGGVVDFIDFHWWPTFNVADAAIVVGVFLFFVVDRPKNRLEERAKLMDRMRERARSRR
jgi:signal peptidase II